VQATKGAHQIEEMMLLLHGQKKKKQQEGVKVVNDELYG